MDKQGLITEVGCLVTFFQGGGKLLEGLVEG